jgi:hypothetical protein
MDHSILPEEDERLWDGTSDCWLIRSAQAHCLTAHSLTLLLSLTVVTTLLESISYY